MDLKVFTCVLYVLFKYFCMKIVHRVKSDSRTWHMKNLKYLQFLNEQNSAKSRDDFKRLGNLHLIHVPFQVY